MLPASGTVGDPSSGVHWKASRRWKSLRSMEATNGSTRGTFLNVGGKIGSQDGDRAGTFLSRSVTQPPGGESEGPPGGAFPAASTEQRQARDQARTFPTRSACQPLTQATKTCDAADERNLPQRQQRGDGRRADQAGNFPTRSACRPLHAGHEDLRSCGREEPSSTSAAGGQQAADQAGNLPTQSACRPPRRGPGA